MTDAEVQAALSEPVVLGLTMWAEGRGDRLEGHSSVEERIGVGVVCRNRLHQPARYGGQSYRHICLASGQFSCWSPLGGAANYAAVMALARRVVATEPTEDPVFEETLFLADGIMRGLLLDQTGGATHYYAPAAMHPPGRVPSWAVGLPCVLIGSQLFLRA